MSKENEDKTTPAVDDNSGLTLTYPASYFWKGYARAGAGVLFSGAIWLLLPSSVYVSIGCSIFLLVFVVFALQVVLRHTSVVELGRDTIVVRGPRTITVSWSELRSIDLSYFSTRRDGESGWMQLKLESVAGTVRIDSDLEMFADVVNIALRHSAILGLDVSSRTRQNAELLLGPGGVHSTI